MKKYVVPHEENNFRPYFLRAAGVVVMLVLILGAFFGSQLHRLALTAGDFLASVLPGVLVDLANADRATNQLSSLSINPVLEEAARLKAEDMAAKSYFAHYSPDGVSPWYWFTQAGYRFAYAGENLAINFDDSSAVNTAWMNSPTHRANILNGNFTEVGIATAKGMYQGRETVFVVQMFGRPLPQVAAVATPSVVVAASPVPVSSEEGPVSGGTETEIPKSVAGTEIAVTPLAESEIKGESDSQSFVAVENAEDLVSTTPVTSIAAPQYASGLERLITSPTNTLALVYFVISIVLFAVLVGVLFVEHSRRVRHVLLVVTLFVLLCVLFYAYRSFVQSEVSVLAAFSSYVS